MKHLLILVALVSCAAPSTNDAVDPDAGATPVSADAANAPGPTAGGAGGGGTGAGGSGQAGSGAAGTGAAGAGAAGAGGAGAASRDAGSMTGGPAVADAAAARDATVVSYGDAGPLPSGAGVVSATRITLTTAAGPFTATTIDGPVWLDAAGGLVFSDKATDAQYVLVPPNQVKPYRQKVGLAQGQSVDPEGALVFCQTLDLKRFLTSGPKVGTIEHLGTHLMGCDDVLGSEGGAYFATDSVQGQVVRYVMPDNRHKHYFENEKRLVPTGIALSPDLGTLYAALRGLGQIRKYTLDPPNIGPPTKGATLVNLANAVDHRGMPLELKGSEVDGIAVDDAGNLYVTGARTIAVFNPAGRCVGLIAVGERTNNAAFGGPDRRTLYITTGTSIYEARVAIPGQLR